MEVDVGDQNNAEKKSTPADSDTNADFLLRQPCTCHASKEIALDFPS